jgi:ATP-binding cassette subfamily F protein uup
LALISLKDVSLHFGEKILFENVNLQIERGERVCLLGRNGAGKSSLMKILTGSIDRYEGQINQENNLTITQLVQTVPNEEDNTIVFDVVAGGLGEQGKLIKAYHEVSHALAEDCGAKYDKLLSQLDTIQHALDASDGWQINQNVETILTQMDLDADVPFSSLSAGWKRRVMVARAIISKPDLLLLDEPTNHLDIDAIKWLENFFVNYEGTLIFVTHDRTFLRKLATRIIEIDRTYVNSWRFDYETFLIKKQEALESEEHQNKQFDKKLAQEEVWIRRSPQARRVRNEGRVRALQQMRSQRADRPQFELLVKMKTQKVEGTGNLVVKTHNVSFTYPGNDTPTIRSVETTILKGDKIGLIGPNGAGKTTLIELLLGKLKADTGTIKFGTKIKVAYFDQIHAQLDKDITMQQNICPDGGDHVEIDGNKRHIIGYLADFLFTPTQVRNPITELSGGEQNRLQLAKLFAQPANVLVLDEPTNDLDMETLEILEELVVNFDGTVLIVSHDRTFLNNVVSCTLAFENNGYVVEYSGGYDDWVRQSAHRKVVKSELAKKNASAKETDQVSTPKCSGKKLTWAENDEREKLPEQISRLETKKIAIHEQMNSPEFYKKPHQKVQEITDTLSQCVTQLEKIYNRWEKLEEQNEAWLATQKK